MRLFANGRRCGIVVGQGFLLLETSGDPSFARDGGRARSGRCLGMPLAWGQPPSALGEIGWLAGCRSSKIGPRSGFLPLKSESAAADAGTPVHTFSGRKQGEMTSDGAEAEEWKEWRRRRRLGPTMSKPGSKAPSLSRSQDSELVGYWLPETAASKGRWGAARGSGSSGPESSPMVARRNDNSG